jgi:hypothetical protein
MGLSFHYSGKIAHPEMLPALVNELEDISKIYNWKHYVNKCRFPEGAYGKDEYDKYIYGISIKPPQCDVIRVCFLSNGRMSDAPHLEFFGKTDCQPESKYLYMLSVKTQYANIEQHQVIIELFRYLSKKYFVDFQMTDEGGYWETGDLSVLKSNFEKYQQLSECFTGAIEQFPIQSDETIETYFERLIRQLKAQKKQK